MDADSSNNYDHSVLSKPLMWLTGMVVRWPVLFLILAGALSIGSIAYATLNMGFKTSRLDLIDPHSSFNKLWINYLDQFEADDDVVVLVEGKSKEEVIPVLEEIYTHLEANNDSFYAVLHQRGLSKVRNKGLHYLPLSELQKINQQLQQVQPVFSGNWNAIGIEQSIFQLNQQLLLAKQINNPQMEANCSDNIFKITQGLNASLSGRPVPVSFQPAQGTALADLSQLDSNYFLANEGRLGMILLRLVKKTEEGFAPGNGPIDRLREITTRVESNHTDIDVGLTGLPIMENDEMQGSQRDTIKSSIISLVGVAILFIAGFGGLRHPLLAVATLLVGLALSFGFLTFAVGHLNILSVSFGVILIGLGIDFGIHYVARYLQLRHKIGSSQAALIETAGSIGPGILTGGITTAIAFFTAALTDFTGVAELGIIAGGGIIVCLIAAFIVLPALIQLADQQRNRYQMPVPLKIDHWIAPLLKAPQLTLLLSVGLAVLLCLGIPSLYYDHNLLNLQAEKLESVQWEHKLIDETDRSVWFALSIASDTEELLERKKRFEALEVVDRVEELASKFPQPDPVKLPLIRQINQQLSQLPMQPPNLSLPSAARLAQLLSQSKQLLSDTASPQTNNQNAIHQLDQTRETLKRIPLASYRQIANQYQQKNASEMLNWLQSLKEVSNPQPPELDDLPQALVSRFLGKDNQQLLRIYPKGNIWDMEALEQFVKEIRKIDLKATGQPVQTYFASRQMQQSYIEAAIYSLIAVLIILLIDFNSLQHSLLALVPVFLGLCMLFGIQGFLNIPLNPANMIVLPLILGIGIDDGVHVIHDFRRRTGRYKLGSSTATAVLITSLTTMIGFGSLMLADHRGLASLGRVLTIGVSCCLFTSLIVLPAILMLLSDSEEDAEETEKQDTGDSMDEIEAVIEESSTATGPDNAAD